MNRVKHRLQITANTISEAEQAKLLELPLRTAKEVKAFLRPGEGFERVAPVILDQLAARPEIAVALKLDPAALKQDVAFGIYLASVEHTADNIAQRAQGNRLATESGVYRALLRVNRFVQNAEDAALVQEFSALSEWVAATHAGGGARGGGAGTGPTAAEPTQPAPVVPAGGKST